MRIVQFQPCRRVAYPHYLTGGQNHAISFAVSEFSETLILVPRSFLRFRNDFNIVRLERCHSLVEVGIDQNQNGFFAVTVMLPALLELKGGLSIPNFNSIHRQPSSS